MDYFGHSPQEWERAMMRTAYSDNGQSRAMQDAMNNPQNYTTARPNMGTKPSFTVGSTRGAGDGRSKGPDTHYYKIQQPSAPARSASAPAPKPAPKPKAKAKPKEPIQYSPEIEQAKERVKSYETGKSPWEQAQANVQSSFIKDTGTNSNNQYDFSGNTFEVNQSSEPNEQAQAAQNQMQNYLTKYSKYKSDN